MHIAGFGGMASLIDPTGGPFNFWQAGSHVGWQMRDEPGSIVWNELHSPDAKTSLAFYTALRPIDDSPFGRIAAMRDGAGAIFKLVEARAG
jgi:predicted enzyme related to lactoylglutathione lyase